MISEIPKITIDKNGLTVVICGCQQERGCNMGMTLKAARVNRNMTQKQAACELGVTSETVRSWEKGKTYPNTEQVRKIEEVYGLTYAEIDFTR